MDFRGRSTQPVSAPASQSVNPGSGRGSFSNGQLNALRQQPVGKLFQVGSIVLLFTVTALVIALTFLVGLSGNSQQGAVLKDKYQAVFLNNGQVYFGHIKSINNKTVDLQNIYYLQTSGSGTTSTPATSASSVSLVKLGCELHAPVDEMIINGEQVIFWENLQDSGQVVKAITQYKQQNSKQTCSQQSQSSTNQAPATNAPTPSPSPTPATKKP